MKCSSCDKEVRAPSHCKSITCAACNAAKPRDRYEKALIDVLAGLRQMRAEAFQELTENWPCSRDKVTTWDLAIQCVQEQLMLRRTICVYCEGSKEQVQLSSHGCDGVEACEACKGTGVAMDESWPELKF